MNKPIALDNPPPGPLFSKPRWDTLIAEWYVQVRGHGCPRISADKRDDLEKFLNYVHILRGEK